MTLAAHDFKFPRNFDFWIIMTLNFRNFFFTTRKKFFYDVSDFSSRDIFFL